MVACSSDTVSCDHLKGRDNIKPFPASKKSLIIYSEQLGLNSRKLQPTCHETSQITTCLQLGAGTAVPGIVAAICGADVILSDREGNLRLQDNLRKTCEINNVPIGTNVRSLPGSAGERGMVSRIMALSWGVFSPELLQLGPQDLILASDCFYDSKGIITVGSF